MIIHFVNFLSHFLHSTARRGANYSTVSSVLVLNQYFWIWFHFLFENWSHSLRLKIEGTSRWNPEFHFIAGGFLKNILLVISCCDRQSSRPDNYFGRHVIQALSTGLFHDFQINKNVHTTYITSNKNQPGSTDFIHVKPFEPNRIKTNGMYQVDRTTNGFRTLNFQTECLSSVCSQIQGKSAWTEYNSLVQQTLVGLESFWSKFVFKYHLLVLERQLLA